MMGYHGQSLTPGLDRAGDVDEMAHWFPLTALAEKTLVLCCQAAFSVLETGGH
jgi:hypothetical protein